MLIFQLINISFTKIYSFNFLLTIFIWDFIFTSYFLVLFYNLLKSCSPKTSFIHNPFKWNFMSRLQVLEIEFTNLG